MKLSKQYNFSHNPKTIPIFNLIKHNLKVNLNLKKKLMEKMKQKLKGNRKKKTVQICIIENKSL